MDWGLRVRLSTVEFVGDHDKAGPGDWTLAGSLASAGLDWAGQMERSPHLCLTSLQRKVG